MAAGLTRSVLTRFLGEDGSLQRTLQRVAGSTDNLDKRMDRFAKGARSAFIGVGVAAAAHFGKELFDLGIQAEAMGRRFDTVFGSAGTGLAADLDKINERFGVSETRMRGLAASAGDLFVPMGFARDAAADMSLEVVNLAGALSEWTGGQRSAADVTQIVSKAILGEREGLKELGVAINEADVKTRIAEKGQQGLTGAAMQQARALATLELVTEKSADALTAYAKGGTEAQKAAGEAAAAIDELKISLAETVVGLAPLVGGIGQLLGGLSQIPGGASAAVGALAGLKLGGGPWGALAGGVIGLGLALNAASEGFDGINARVDEFETAAKKLGTTLDQVGNLGGVDRAEALQLIERQALATAYGFDTFGEAAETARDKIARFLSFARPLTVEVLEVRDAVRGAADALRDAAGADTVAKFEEMLQSISFEDLTTKFNDAADEIVSIWGEIPDRIEEVDIGKAISDALTLKAQQDAFEADMRTLALGGYSALVDSLRQNPDRAEAIALMDYFAADMAAAADFSEAAGLAVDQVQAAINAAVRRLTTDTAVWNEFNVFMSAQGYAAMEAFAAGIDRGAAGGAGQRIVDGLRRSILRGGALGLE